jgi:hypothetical protein
MAALSFTVAALFGACSHADRSATFMSQRYRYTITIPMGWSGMSAERVLAAGEEPRTCCGGVDIIGARPSTRVSTMPLPGLVIGAQAAGDVTLASWTDQVIEIVANQKGCTHPARRDPIEWGAVKGTVLRYPNCPNGSGLYHLWAVAVDHGRAFHIVWFKDHWSEKRDRKEFDRVVESMTFAR